MKRRIYGDHHGIREVSKPRYTTNSREIKSSYRPFFLPLRAFIIYAVIVFLVISKNKWNIEGSLWVSNAVTQVYRGYKVIWRNFLVKPQYFPNNNDIRPYSDPTVASPNTNTINIYPYET